MPGLTLPIRALLVYGQALGALRLGLLPSLGNTLGEAILFLLLFGEGQRPVVSLDQLPVGRAVLQRDVVGLHLR